MAKNTGPQNQYPRSDDLLNLPNAGDLNLVLWGFAPIDFYLDFLAEEKATSLR